MHEMDLVTFGEVLCLLSEASRGRDEQRDVRAVFGSHGAEELLHLRPGNRARRLVSLALDDDASSVREIRDHVCSQVAAAALRLNDLQTISET